MLRGCLHGGGKIPLWNNFTLGLHEEISVRIVPKIDGSRMIEELKMAGDKKTYNLGPSTLFTGVNN